MMYCKGLAACAADPILKIRSWNSRATKCTQHTVKTLNE
jgi:hypothetical protein